MPTRQLSIEYIIDGGWSTDLGNTLSAANVAESGGVIRVPFLTRAENTQYGLDGRVKKSEGAIKFNSGAISGTPTIKGLFEYFRQNTNGTPTRKRLAHAGTVIYKEDLDGTWDSLATGKANGAIPDYTVANDILVIASSAVADVPFSWDQTTFQNLAGSPPNFSFSEWHQSRLFAAGVVSAPSTVYWSNRNNPEDWTDDTGAGNITISPQDGDRIVALASHRGDLIVFKGPYHGSIWRIKGSAPFGDQAFRVELVMKGVGALTHRCVVNMGNDKAFMDVDGTWHSLNATAEYGDYNNRFLSFDIDSYIREQITTSQLENAQAVTHPNRNQIYITVPSDSSSTNNRVLVLDYRFKRPRWSILTNPSAASIAIFKNSSLVDTLHFGGYDDGQVLIGEQFVRNWDGNPIGMNVEFPHANMGKFDGLKTLTQLRLNVKPTGAYDITVNYIQDGDSQTTTFTQSSGGALGSFVLGTDPLGGATYESIIRDDVQGEFRNMVLQMLQGNINENAEIQSIGMSVSMSDMGGE
jgi:hypothetical protein